ncbi:hypothetical protein I4641_13790 [Waterburya agarophytonicola K14]|uniref:Uncharacterized protein n=1 Tax=Waterburya agarophytonicola KI4 TaxID=2874699 RepID=A0A964BTT9_9CYAN|nr:hypothetical protein [Waterburya agarophytonicola]MCC0178052.1 hypothetical protein [Waterburya agarophytonicola KI4]
MESPFPRIPEAEEIDCIESTHEAAVDHIHDCCNLTRKETTIFETLEEIKKSIALLDMRVRRGREERRETKEVDSRLRSLESRILINEMDAENYLFKFALIAIGLIIIFSVVDAVLK